MAGMATIGIRCGLRILTMDDELRENGLKTQFGAHVTNLPSLPPGLLPAIAAAGLTNGGRTKATLKALAFSG